MIKLIKRYLGRMAQWATEDDAIFMDPAPAPQRRRNMVRNSTQSQSIDSVGGLNFTVFPASGGTVVQFSRYDTRTDTNRVELYIVTDKDDLGQELSLIITKESLTR